MHAGKAVDSQLFERKQLCSWYWRATFGRSLGTKLFLAMPQHAQEYKRGILAQATLTEVVGWSDDAWYVEDQYGFILDNIRPLPEPIPCNGLPRLFYVPDERCPSTTPEPSRPSVRTEPML